MLNILVNKNFNNTSTEHKNDTKNEYYKHETENWTIRSHRGRL